MKRLKVTLAIVLLSVGALSTVSANEGATSCSREISILGIGWGTSVECAEGYYAKCGIFNAKCVKNPE
ncbi:hypothetical protein [Marinoscillum sp.]|uniref:hypothetical protein n=1 Tax=Marinoscillum sp. TaxID=2024838 RepID=UPI003BAC3BFF